MAYSLGIDLGTTYSAAAIARADRLEIFQLGERAATIPSMVLLRADGEVLTGEAAERRALAEPTRTGREFKRRLGDPTPIILGGTPYGAEALLAHLLRAIVERVSQQLGERPAAIALCHPAAYGAYKLDLLQQAVRQADIGDVTLLTEPEAAALDYARQERVPSGSVFAIYDFGGGTFDATILRKTDTGFEALGQPEGLERLGGIDFDEALFRRALEVVAAAGVTVDPNDPATMAAIARLRDECRRGKEALSSDTDATIPIFLPGIQTEMRITRAEFEDMIRPRVHETIAALGRATRSAGLEYAGIDRILLVGGSSRIPLVAEMVREATGRPVAVDAHPKHTMAMGAAYVAEQHREATASAASAVAGVAVGAPIAELPEEVAAPAAEPDSAPTAAVATGAP
ncbi:MAG TPA: Hsp70 family protein, partial [Solirubrobacterales bacterium]|nr:Hsp70 family protein [Solirubrobacterales bacterium]